jgi:hypothetical protein
MGTQRSNQEQIVDRDGVRRIEQKRTGSSGTWLIGLALGFTVLCLGLSAWLVLSPGDTPSGDEGVAPPEPRAPSPLPSPARASARPKSPAAMVMQVVTNPKALPSSPSSEEPMDPPPSEPAPSGEPPAEKTGLALFRPGTKPLKQGLIVPEGYELPPGYVRHYQTTDDGQQLKAILMFHPDYQPVDANGQPIPLPENRVVPPELAPPGFPMDVLEVPAGPEGSEPIP